MDSFRSLLEGPAFKEDFDSQSHVCPMSSFRFFGTNGAIVGVSGPFPFSLSTHILRDFALFFPRESSRSFQTLFFSTGLGGVNVPPPLWFFPPALPVL